MFPNIIRLVGSSKIGECFEFHAGVLWVDPSGWLPLLCASLDVPIGLGAIINADEFTLGTICEMRGRARGFPCEVFLGKKMEDYKLMSPRLNPFSLQVGALPATGGFPKRSKVYS
jgi:hypothetical protein